METLPKKSPYGRKDDKSPNPVDVHVGNRIRLRRTLLGYSQQFMASKLGLTFQQVQKYEKGDNRVGASRLFDISKVLKVSMDFFFEDMDKEIEQQSPMWQLAPEEIDYFLEDNDDEIDLDPMKRQETLELVRAYYRITNPKLSKSLLNLVIVMSKNNASMTHKS